jgi:hypothetical protein
VVLMSRSQSIDSARQESAEYRWIGDLMQSEASRLAEWAEEAMQKHPTTLEMPYEVRMALLGLKDAIAQWTDVRIGYAMTPLGQTGPS